MVGKPYTGVVYRATHIDSGTIYIGKSIRGLEYRRSSHESSSRIEAVEKLKCGGRGNRFHSALWKYGVESFMWEALFYSDDDNLLLEVKSLILREHKESGRKVYNLAEGGKGPTGFKHTPESKAKLSAAGKGRFPTEETRARLREGVRKSWDKNREARTQQLRAMLTDPARKQIRSEAVRKAWITRRAKKNHPHP